MKVSKNPLQIYDPHRKRFFLVSIVKKVSELAGWNISERNKAGPNTAALCLILTDVMAMMSSMPSPSCTTSAYVCLHSAGTRNLSALHHLTCASISGIFWVHPLLLLSVFGSPSHHATAPNTDRISLHRPRPHRCPREWAGCMASETTEAGTQITTPNLH